MSMPQQGQPPAAARGAILTGLVGLVLLLSLMVDSRLTGGEIAVGCSPGWSPCGCG